MWFQTICKLSHKVRWCAKSFAISANKLMHTVEPEDNTVLFLLLLFDIYICIYTVHKGFVCESKPVVEVQRCPQIRHPGCVSVLCSGGRRHGEPRWRGHYLEAGDARTIVSPTERVRKHNCVCVVLLKCVNLWRLSIFSMFVHSFIGYEWFSLLHPSTLHLLQKMIKSRSMITQYSPSFIHTIHLM